MTISPPMISEGNTTAAIQGSKYTSIPWRPRKYQGALEGFGVLVGLAGSSIGASTVMLHTRSTSSNTQPAMNSARTRYGQVWTLSGRSATGSEARARPEVTLTSSGSWIWLPGLTFSAMAPSVVGDSFRLERGGDAAVFPDAPEVQDHQDGGDDRDEDAVQDVEAEQRRCAHHRAGGQQ